MCVFQNPVAVTMLGCCGWKAVLDAPNTGICTDVFIQSFLTFSSAAGFGVKQQSELEIVFCSVLFWNLHLCLLFFLFFEHERRLFGLRWCQNLRLRAFFFSSSPTTGNASDAHWPIALWPPCFASSRRCQKTRTKKSDPLALCCLSALSAPFFATFVCAEYEAEVMFGCFEAVSLALTAWMQTETYWLPVYGWIRS